MAIIGFITLVSLVIISVLFLIQEQQTMLNEKKTKLINLVEVSYSLVDNEYKKYEKGLISEIEAKENAKKIIATIRYENNNYVWINDISMPFPKMVMHPISSNLNDKVMDSEKFNCATSLEIGDKSVKSIKLNNMSLFLATIEATKDEKSGFINYSWSKPTSNDPNKLFRKLAYVKKYDNWGWILGTGIYIDDVEEQFFSSIIFAVKEILITI